MYKIVLTGPESTGKTTLAQQLAQYYNVSWVPEYARDYVATLGRTYTEEDLLYIAQQQMQQIHLAKQQGEPFLFIDTALLVIKVWSQYKYGRCAEWILEQLQRDNTDLYILCSTDIPWTYDPLREHPHHTAELYRIYKKELCSYNFPFIEVEGSLQNRLNHIHSTLQKRFDLFHTYKNAL